MKLAVNLNASLRFCALAIVLCATLLGAVRYGSLPAIAASDASGIAKISAYAGTWTSRIVHYTTAYSKARVETTTVRNDCWRSADFYVCNQFVKGESVALLVYTYDAKDALYHIQVVPKDGSAPNAPGTLTIVGNTWTFPWQDKDNDKTVYIRIINVFTDPRTIVFHEEFSLDNIHWTKTADGNEHRVPTP